MADDTDPMFQFFEGEESVNLYAVLGLTDTATTNDIRSAYRRLALRYHPDKRATEPEAARRKASEQFQRVGYAYAVLVDGARRARYDRTGRTDEGGIGFGGDAEGGWEGYFRDLFEVVTRERLDVMKKEYQGSEEEHGDVKEAYKSTGGDLGEIMAHIPHSTFDDEQRIVAIVNDLITRGELTSTPTWAKSSKDKKGKRARATKAQKEAREAEDVARELGVWDEFYGSGKTGERGKARKGKTGKENSAEAGDASEATLKALMLKRKKDAVSFLDDLAAKYAEPEPKRRSGKGKKRQESDDTQPDGQSTGKKARGAPPDIDDAEFEALQARLFGDKAAMGTKEANGKKATVTKGEKRTGSSRKVK